MKRLLKVVQLLGAATSLLGVATAAQNQYSVVDLGDAFEDYSKAYGVNAWGQVVGVFGVVAPCCIQHAFYFDGKERHDLTPGLTRGSDGVANAINDAGDIVGGIFREVYPPRGEAVRWRAGEMQLLGYVGGYRSYAVAINSYGQIAGWSTVGEDWRVVHVVKWEDGVIEDLDPGGIQSSGASAINGSGAVAGVVVPDVGPLQGAVWFQGKRQDLPMFNVGGINDAGQVVGANEGPVLWDPVEGLQELGSLGHVPSGDALAINNLGQVVGWSYTDDGDLHGFIWQQGVMTDLNLLIPPDSGWSIKTANAINDAGEIAGIGFKDGVQSSRACLLLIAK